MASGLIAETMAPVSNRVSIGALSVVSPFESAIMITFVIGTAYLAVASSASSYLELARSAIMSSVRRDCTAPRVSERVRDGCLRGGAFGWVICLGRLADLSLICEPDCLGAAAVAVFGRLADLARSGRRSLSDAIVGSCPPLLRSVA